MSIQTDFEKQTCAGPCGRELPTTEDYFRRRESGTLRRVCIRCQKAKRGKAAYGSALSRACSEPKVNELSIRNRLKPLAMIARALPLNMRTSLATWFLNVTGLSDFKRPVNSQCAPAVGGRIKQDEVLCLVCRCAIPRLEAAVAGFKFKPKSKNRGIYGDCGAPA